MTDVTFTSRNKKTKGFLEMARLLNFLEKTSDKVEKARAIREARESGLIDAEEAIDLAVEFC